MPHNAAKGCKKKKRQAVSAPPCPALPQAWPFVRTLEAQAGRILSEAIDVAPKLTRAYPYLFTKGSWQNLFIFRGRTWNTEVCDVMPRTCQLLVPEIPTKPGLPTVVPNNEEIVLFRSVDGAYVGPHSGAVNNQINIHLTLKGGQGAFLNVAGDRRELKAGKAMCFQVGSSTATYTAS